MASERARFRALLAVASAVLWLVAGCGDVRPAPGEPSRSGVYDAIVVLGHHPPVTADGHIDAELARRVERGVELFRAGYSELVLLVGGEGVRGVTEPSAMTSHARALGLPEAAIRSDAHSRDTIDNARFARKLLCGRATLPCRPRVLVVTSDYHVERAQRLFRCAGMDAYGAAARLEATAAQRRRMWRHEAMTWLYYLVVDECARAGRPVGKAGE